MQLDREEQSIPRCDSRRYVAVFSRGSLAFQREMTRRISPIRRARGVEPRGSRRGPQANADCYR